MENKMMNERSLKIRMNKILRHDGIVVIKTKLREYFANGYKIKDDKVILCYHNDITDECYEVKIAEIERVFELDTSFEPDILD